MTGHGLHGVQREGEGAGRQGTIHLAAGWGPVEEEGGIVVTV